MDDKGIILNNIISSTTENALKNVSMYNIYEKSIRVRIHDDITNDVNDKLKEYSLFACTIRIDLNLFETCKSWYDLSE